MSREPKRLGALGTVISVLLILALIAGTGFVVYLCVDMVNAEPEINHQMEVIEMPTEAPTEPLVYTNPLTGEMLDALRAGCDTFVTADVKYNQFWDAKELGLNLIDAGHFHTENPVTVQLAAELALNFPEIQVKISETHQDCMKFY